MADKRFVATIQLYVYGKNDLDAKIRAENLAKMLDRVTDGRAKLIELVEQPEGTGRNRQIKI